jgi:hypothetical protein
MKKTLIKTILLLAGVAIVVTTLFLTRSLTEKIKKREAQTLSLYVSMYEYYIGSLTLESTDPDGTGNDSDFLLLLIDEIIPSIDSPFILTDANDMPLPPYESWSLNIDLKDIPEDEQEEFMVRYVDKMKASYEPLLIKDRPGDDGKVMQKLYYTHSSLVDMLSWFPVAAIIVVLGLVWLAYTAFNSSRKSEESLVWVGMAKEAAHQLGTPLSSLMAWIEIIRFGKDEPEQIEMTIPEMTKDIERLNTIAKRFSKIGSVPDKEESNLTDLLEGVGRYFQTRLPHLGKQVDIRTDLESPVYAQINVDLIQWVFENLLKNAAEAIDDLSGTVEMKMFTEKGGKIKILVCDTGKGMTKRVKNRIFRAGFTTKKRGWGLGLALTKRIIEEYHDGRIYVKESQPGVGTTFAIELDANIEKK